MSRRPELVYGVHSVDMLLDRDPAGVLELWLLATRRDRTITRLEDKARAAGTAVHRVPRETLTRMSASDAHQGVIARYRSVAGTVSARAPALEDLLERVGPHTLLLVLDGVQDPHNLGACLRTANAAGADAVLVPKHRSARLNPAVRKAASGAAEATPVVTVTNLARALRGLADAGVRIVGAHPEAETDLHRGDLVGPIALVLGGEGRGMRRLTRECCDLLIRIPMVGAVQSLNASVAAAICLYEVVRQRSIATGGDLA